MCLVRFTFSVLLAEEPERHLVEVTVEAFDFDDDGGDVVIGKGRCFFADLERALEELGVGPEYILDTISATADYIEPLFESGGREFKPGIVELLGEDSIGLSMLILDRLEILPEYRGKGLSKRILSEMIRHFSPNTSLIALKAFPLQLEVKSPNYSPSEWEAAMKLESFPSNPARATRRLMDLYSELGFKDTGIDGIMVRLS